jgi:hypothetical protein
LKTEENQGKTVSRWPVAGPSGCVLTSSQQSDKRGKKKEIPCLALTCELLLYLQIQSQFTFFNGLLLGKLPVT